jgi:hypothetical protein
VGGDRLGLALDVEGPHLARAKPAAHQPLGGLADQHRVGLGGRLQSGGEVRGVADGGVVHLQVVADRADDHDSRVDSDPRVQGHPPIPQQPIAQRGERIACGERRANRSLGGVLVRDGRAEERHQAVTGQLVDDSLEAVDLGEGDLEVLLEQLAVYLRIEPLCDLRRSDEVAEQDRHPLALARRSAGAAQLVRQGIRNVSGESRQAVFGRRRPGARRIGGRRRRLAVQSFAAVRTELEPWLDDGAAGRAAG